MKSNRNRFHLQLSRLKNGRALTSNLSLPISTFRAPTIPSPPKGRNSGEKRKEVRSDTPSPSLTLATGLASMPNGEVLHPFAPQNADWDNLWLERDGGFHFHSEARRLINKQIGEPDKDAVREVCTFFNNMKKNTRSLQCRVDWKNPSARIKSVLDRISKTIPAYVASAPSRKQSKQQR